jgi:hypothetical protein
MIYSRIIRFLATAAFVVGFSTIAQAQATRTWVSGVGDDANPCSRTAPCKTFAGAISKTAPGGEISVLDPGGFGTINITKAITLNGTGTLAGILAANVNGVLVNAQAADTIILRDISINGANTTTGNGIRYIAGGSVMVDHCWIYGFKGTGANGRGIAVEKGSDGHLKVLDTVIENVGDDGISINTTAGVVRATIDRTRVMNCGANGFHPRNFVRAVVRNSIFSHNTGNGVTVESSAGGFSVARLWENQISLNAGGVRAGVGSGTSTAELALNQINNNTTNGILVSSGGVIETFSNNSIRGNSPDGCPGCTPVGPGS